MVKEVLHTMPACKQLAAKFAYPAVTAAVILSSMPALARVSRTPRTGGAIHVEAETYNVNTAVNLDGLLIRDVACEDASGGRAVEGISSPGESIELRLVLSEPRCFSDSLTSAGAVGAVRSFRILFFDEFTFELVAEDLVTTGPGLGFG